jgi:hypothetical protein
MALKTLEDYLWDAYNRGVTMFEVVVNNCDTHLEICFCSKHKEEILLSYKVEDNRVYLADEPAGFKESENSQS